jgi:cytochrome c oxidase cbb3-type subunit IV
MYKQFYAGMSVAELPLFALFLFLAIFFGVVIRVFVVRKRSDFDAVASMPLVEPPEGARHD